jgi:Ca-activated chloride channel family protein
VSGLELLHPGWLLLGLLVPVAMILRRRRGEPALRFAPLALTRPDPGTPPLPRSWRQRLVRLPSILGVLGLLLVAVAIARPVERVTLPRTIEGLDILLCIDTSSSMAANDLHPKRTRLDLAKGAAASFVEGRTEDRIGLVRFARFPDLRCPLTLDHGALREVLADVELVEREGPEDATGIGTAVAHAARILKDGEEGSRVVVLLTDGEENVATEDTPDEIAPLHAAQLCRELGVRVYVIVAGRGEPTAEGGWVALDTSQVEDLAERTGGRFFEARDAGTVAAVYAEIDALERGAIPKPRYRLEERFAPFLLAALLALALSRFLATTWLAVLP